MRLSESIEESGYFWLSDNSENKILGTLRISKIGESSLELKGRLGNSKVLSSHEEFNRILGLTDAGEKVTLEKCIVVKEEIIIGGSKKQNIIVQKVFFGFHFSEDKSISFNKIVFSFEGLDEWLSISGIKWNMSNITDNKITVDYSKPKPIIFNMSDFNLEIGFSFESESTFKTAQISQKANLILKSDEMRPFDEFLSIISKIQNFICLSVDRWISFNDCILGYLKELFINIGEGKHIEKPIKIYFKSALEDDSTPYSFDIMMLFRFVDVKNSFENYLSNWIAKYKDYGPVFDLYFSTIRGAYEYLEVKFLSLIQGIETLHRRNSDEKDISENTFNTILNQISMNISEEDWEWVKSKLKYANELSLRKRIKRIITPFQHLFNFENKIDAFISKVVDTRNYLTHYDKSLENHCARGKELYMLNCKLKALLQLHFLDIIGFSIEDINKIANNYNYLRINRLYPL